MAGRVVVSLVSILLIMQYWIKAEMNGKRPIRRGISAIQRPVMHGWTQQNVRDGWCSSAVASVQLRHCRHCPCLMAMWHSKIVSSAIFTTYMAIRFKAYPNKSTIWAIKHTSFVEVINIEIIKQMSCGMDGSNSILWHCDSSESWLVLVFPWQAIAA